MDPLRLQFDAFELNEADARLRRDGKPLSVPPRAFAVLCTLARQPGQLVTKDALLDAVWGHRHVSESVLKTTISELRAALADDAREPRYIETASRRGYRFIARVGNGSQGAEAPAVSVPAAAPRFSAGAPFIGREHALAELRDAWRRAQAGERQLVWITGEAGVGKSRLVDSFLRELEPGVATYGQCVEHFGTGEPYLPILEAVRELCRRDPRLVTSMRTVAPTWLVQMPWLVSEADRASLYTDVGGAHQDRMVREMRELMDRFTVNRPVIFVLEDLHWSDAGTLRMMEHFARRPREVRLLWIATFRLTQVVAEDHPLRALRQELKLHKLCREIQLDPFSEAELSAYLAKRIPSVPVSENFVRRLHAHTDGLPLFVRNVADSFMVPGAEGARMHELLQAGSRAPLPVPDSLAGVIENQIERMAPGAQKTLEAASVLGTEFRAGYLAALTRRDIDEVCDELDTLVRRQLWVKLAGIDDLPDGGIDPRYAFLHALYKHVFYERISMTQRVQLHRGATQTLTAARAAGAIVPAAELASHAERGHQYVEALRHYADAADHAVGHFAPADALNLADAGLKLLDRVSDASQRAELELGIVHRRGVAAAQLLGVGSAEALSSFERTVALCEALPETPQRALLQLSGLGLARYVCGEYRASQAIAERALAVAERHDDDVVRVSAALLLGMIQAVRGQHVAACATLERGIDACARVPHLPPGTFVIDPETALHANISIPLMSLGRIDEAISHNARAHARAKSIGQPTARMLALWTEGMVNVRTQDHERVAACADELARVVEASMLTQGMGPAKWLKGWALAHLGSPREGHRLIREGYEVHARLGMYAGNTETLGYAAMALVRAGDWEQAETQIEESVALAERIDERVMYPYLLRLRGLAALTRGGRQQGQERLLEALAAARAHEAPYDELKCLYLMEKEQLVPDAEAGAMRRVFELLTQGRQTPFMQKVAAALA
jgi:DNA-binding winged helix-turn-helix (wHTH) protein/tetratricopeptide (TPR) repeat protein